LEAQALLLLLLLLLRLALLLLVHWRSFVGHLQQDVRQHTRA
jgi:hypothetical protein